MKVLNKIPLSPFIKGGIIAAFAMIFCASQKISADTIAYWRFEEGTAGVTHDGDNDDFYVDSTANANHMSTTSSGTRPVASADVPFSTVPATGLTNTLSLDFGNWASFLETVGGKMVDSYDFTKGWTIEASVKLHSIPGNWRGIISKGGNFANWPAYYLMFNGGDSVFQTGPETDATNLWWCDGRPTPVGYGAGATTPQTGEWYNLAITFDTNTLNLTLYIKEETDVNYEWEATRSNATDGISLFWDEPWVIGTMFYWGNPESSTCLDGIIDEVRISDEPLNPTQFLGYAEVLTPQPPVIKNVEYSPYPEPTEKDTVEISARITTANSTITNATYEYSTNGIDYFGPFDLLTNAVPNIYVANIISQIPYTVVSFKMRAVNGAGQSTTTDVSTYTVYEDIPWQTVIVSSDSMSDSFSIPTMELSPNGLAGFVYKSASNSNAYYAEESSLGVIKTPVAISADSEGFATDMVFGTNGNPRVILSADFNEGGLTYVQRTNGAWTTPMIILTNFFDEYHGVISIVPNQKQSVLWYQDDGSVGELIDISASGDFFSSVEVSGSDWEVSSNYRRPFGMIGGTDGKRRIALSYHDAFMKDKLRLGTETAPDSGIFDWDVITTNLNYSHILGFTLDDNNYAYIVVRDYVDYLTGGEAAAVFENSGGAWEKHVLDKAGDWLSCGVAVNPADGTAWVAQNSGDLSNPILYLWSNRSGNWKKEHSITNGPFVDTVAGFGFNEFGTMKIAFKPGWGSSDLVYMYSTKFGVPEPISICYLSFIIFYLLKSLPSHRN